MKKILLSIAISCSLGTYAQTPQILYKPTTNQKNLGSTEGMAMGSNFYIAYQDESNGLTLYKTTGSVTSMTKVKQIHTNEISGTLIFLAATSNKLYFKLTSEPDYRTYIWATDGTESGTMSLIEDTKSFSNFTVLNDTLFFSTGYNWNGATHDVEVYKTDGTVSGTDLIYTTTSETTPKLTGYASKLYITLSIGKGEELYKLTGSPLQPTLVRDIYASTASSSPQEFVVYNDSLYFAAKNTALDFKLWVTTGDSASTRQVLNTNSTGPFNPTAFKLGTNNMYFVADGFVSSVNTGAELWVMNGSTPELVKDLYPYNSDGSNISILGVAGNTIYFNARDNQLNPAPNFYKSDGTLSGTIKITDGQKSGFVFKNDFYVSDNNTIYINGISTEAPFMSTISGLGAPSRIGNSANTLYFSTSNASIGVGLLSTEGSNLDKKEFFYYAISGDLLPLQTINDELYFGSHHSNGTVGSNGYIANNGKYVGLNGFTYMNSVDILYKLDSNANKVNSYSINFSDINSPTLIGKVNNYLLFKGYDVTNSSLTVTVLWDESNPGQYYQKLFTLGYVNADKIRTIGNDIYFIGNNMVWKGSFGSSTVDLVYGEYPNNLEVLNGKLYIEAVGGLFTPNADFTGVDTIVKAGQGVKDITLLGSKLIFTSVDSLGLELWESDGTANGTKLLKDITPNQSTSFFSDYGTFFKLGNNLLFTADTVVNGDDYELWITDGTSAGTKMVKNINSTASSKPCLVQGSAIGNKFYFPATTLAEGKELWETDGTSAGTKLTANLNTAENSAFSKISYDNNQAQVTGLRNEVYFIANDGNGFALWKLGDVGTGIIKVKDFAKINTYPNPTNGIVNINIPEGAFKIEIINSIGQVVTQTEVENQPNYSFDLSQFDNGIYITKITQNEKTYISKIVLSK